MSMTSFKSLPTPTAGLPASVSCDLSSSSDTARELSARIIVPASSRSYDAFIETTNTSDSRRLNTDDPLTSNAVSDDVFVSGACNASLLTSSTCDALTRSTCSDNSITGSESSISLSTLNSVTGRDQAAVSVTHSSASHSANVDGQNVVELHAGDDGSENCNDRRLLVDVNNMCGSHGLDAASFVVNSKATSIAGTVDQKQGMATRSDLGCAGPQLSECKTEKVYRTSVSADATLPSEVTPPAMAALTPVTDAVRFQETRYKDGGAHWYRSSAVLLKYHRSLSLQLFMFRIDSSYLCSD